MSHCTTKPTKWHVHPAKTQIRLGIRPVWSESSVGSSAPTISSCRRWIKDWSDWTDAQADPSLRWVHGSFCWFCCAAVHICNLGKGFMHFKNLQILYLYWSNILDVSIESFFHADGHVIHVHVFCWLVYVCGFCVYICFALKFSIFFLNWQCKFLSWSLSTWSKLASQTNVPYEILSQWLAYQQASCHRSIVTG